MFPSSRRRDSLPCTHYLLTPLMGNKERKAVLVTQSLAYVNIIPTHLYTPVYNTPLHTRLRYYEIVTF